MIEDYLKVLFNLGEWDPDERSNANLAARLGVSTSSVSEMIRKLTAQGLVSHEPYGGIELTAAGRTRAVEMVRRHRLVETYLVERLGYSWDEVHDEAEVLEHAVSPRMVERMDHALGRPWRDPHGDPIPTPDGVLHQPPTSPVATLSPGSRGFVARFIDHDPELLRWFAGLGVGLDTEVEVVEQKPFGGPLVVAVHTGGEPRRVELGIQAVLALCVAQHRPHPTGAEEPGAGCPYVGCQHLDTIRAEHSVSGSGQQS